MVTAGPPGGLCLSTYWGWVKVTEGRETENANQGRFPISSQCRQHCNRMGKPCAMVQAENICRDNWRRIVRDTKMHGLGKPALQCLTFQRRRWKTLWVFWALLMKNRCKKGMVLSLKCQGWREGSRGKTRLYSGKGDVLTNHFFSFFFFFGCRPFFKVYWIRYNIASSVLCLFLAPRHVGS